MSGVATLPQCFCRPLPVHACKAPSHSFISLASDLRERRLMGVQYEDLTIIRHDARCLQVT